MPDYFHDVASVPFLAIGSVKTEAQRTFWHHLDMLSVLTVCNRNAADCLRDMLAASALFHVDDFFSPHSATFRTLAEFPSEGI